MNKRIKEVRTSEKLSQEKFGKKIGVSRDTIANIEMGRIDIKDIFVTSICREFNINEKWLRYGTEPKYSIINDDYTKISVDIDKHDPKARQAIIDYWNLSKQDKELFWNFIERFALKKGED